MANDDVEYRYAETIPAMYDWLETHPDTGLIHPWTRGEEADPYAIPYDFYVQDATGVTVRLDLNGHLPLFDEEYLYVGWADLDYGEIIKHLGFRTVNDRRFPVKHDLGNSSARSKKSFLMAMERRNRLILSAKWWIVGIDKWRGIEAYNQSLPPHKKIPTQNELANYTNEQLEQFWRSIHFEHPQIHKMNGTLDPNEYWENPVLGGRNMRTLWEEGKLEDAIKER